MPAVLLAHCVALDTLKEQQCLCTVSGSGATAPVEHGGLQKISEGMSCRAFILDKERYSKRLSRWAVDIRV